MKPVLLILAAAAFGGCSLLFPGGDPSPPDGTTLSSGTSFGECIGYCVTELTIEGRSAVLVYSGWETGEVLPDVRHERQLSEAERTVLTLAYNRDALHRADGVYGCPDCADGGAEWVSDGAKRVTFEFGAEVAEIQPFIDAMRDLRATFPDAPTP